MSLTVSKVKICVLFAYCPKKRVKNTNWQCAGALSRPKLSDVSLIDIFADGHNFYILHYFSMESPGIPLMALSIGRTLE